LEGITERKSADLKRRKELLEAEVERITTAVARSQRIIEDFQRLDAVARELDFVTRELNDLNARKIAQEAEIAALQRSVQEFRRQLKAYGEAWPLRRPFMRQPDAIRADIRGAEANINQKTAALTAVNGQIAARPLSLKEQWRPARQHYLV
jgi:chromosome segregation ATPase